MQSNREHGESVVDVPRAQAPEDFLRVFQAQYGRRYPPCLLYGDGTADRKIADFLKAKSDELRAGNTQKRFVFT